MVKNCALGLEYGPRPLFVNFRDNFNLPRIARIKIRTVVRIVKSWTGYERAISQSDSRI